MPHAIEQDLTIYPMLDELRACLCNALGDSAPCFCGLLVGDQIPVEYASGCDDDNCGAAYVRLVSAQPSEDAVDQNTGRATCFTLIAYTVAVGIVRCVPMGDDRGNPPEQSEVQDTSLLLLSDMKLMRQAIQCCFGSTFDEVDYDIIGFQPLPNEGGIAGGEWTITIEERF